MRASHLQFVDAVAVAMITPGPVVITAAFIGYLVAGVVGATAAAPGMFLPVVVVLLAPSFKRWAKNPQLNAFVRGVTAAATSAIAGALVVLARRSVYDLPTILICGDVRRFCMTSLLSEFRQFLALSIAS